MSASMTITGAPLAARCRTNNDDSVVLPLPPLPTNAIFTVASLIWTVTVVPSRNVVTSIGCPGQKHQRSVNLWTTRVAHSQVIEYENHFHLLRGGHARQASVSPEAVVEPAAGDAAARGGAAGHIAGGSPLVVAGPHIFAGYAPGPIGQGRSRAQSGHSPKISTVWSTSMKPASLATRCVQRSTARPSTSTLRPQERHVTW